MIQEKSIEIENRIGFIQGRLSDLVNNRIQLFPVKNWKAELKEASRNEIRTLEWTIDSETITENPLILPKSIPENKRLLPHPRQKVLPLPFVERIFLLTNVPMVRCPDSKDPQALFCLVKYP